MSSAGNSKKSLKKVRVSYKCSGNCSQNCSSKKDKCKDSCDDCGGDCDCDGDCKDCKCKEDRDGEICIGCKQFYDYAEPNQPDGTMICYSCRSTKPWLIKTK